MKTFVLVDCNNFYVSCEKLFNPKLEKQAVVVLSSNDGCIVARSQEAKDLGIQMGEPYFKIKDFCNRQKVVVLSSNYSIYGDISNRIMNVLSSCAEDIELYSIDEAFLTFSSEIDMNDLISECIEIRKKIKQWIGIPVSIGIAPTKTLAKVANSLAKKQRDRGVFSLTSSLQEKILQNYPVGDIWGVGRRLTQRFYEMGIRTAWEFREADPIFIRKKMGVIGEQMLWELRGISCYPLEESAPNKSICYSRSFGKVVENLTDLEEAVSTYAYGASLKMREQNSCAQAIYVYLETLIDSKLGTRGHEGMSISFDGPVNETSKLISAAKSCLHKLYSPDARYKKCGVVLLDLLAEDLCVQDLFLSGLDPKKKALQEAMDALNNQYGRNAVFYGAMGIERSWKNRSAKRSEYYDDWKGLPTVFAK